MNLYEFSEADEAATSARVALQNFAYQVRYGETMGIIDMYERAALRAGCNQSSIEMARERTQPL